MALRKYPNRFAVVYPAAQLFHMDGIERKREPALRRALDLLSHACRLLDQNSDPAISETSLRIEMADVLLGLGEEERAIAMLRANNPCGVNDEAIGCILAGMAGRREEAMSLLSMALLRHISGLIQIVGKFGDIYEDRGRLDQADEVLAWLYPFLRGLERPDQVSYLTKYRAAALGCRAQIAWKSGRKTDAEAFLREALALADRFDAAPNYRADALRWYEGPDTAMAYDSMGATARAAVRQVFTQQGEDPEAGAFLSAFESEN